jgi:hypothetical protein
MTDARIASLEQKISEMQVELAALKGNAAPQPQPPRDEGTRVVALNDERRDLPNLEQLRKLYAVVRHRVPEQKSREPDAAFRGFAGAFRYVSNCPRLAAPNNKYSLGWWFDDMTHWLRQRDAMTLDITPSSFIAAALACGDVHFVEHDPSLGHVWEFAIAPPNYGGKRAASDGWKRVLEGSVLAPSQPARQVKIVSGY